MYHKVNSSVLFSISAFILLFTLTTYLLEHPLKYLAILRLHNFSFFECAWLCVCLDPYPLFPTFSAWQMPTYLLNAVQVSPPPGSLPSGPLPLLVCKLVVPLWPPTHFIVVIQFIVIFIWVCIGHPVHASSWGGSRHVLPGWPLLAPHWWARWPEALEPNLAWCLWKQACHLGLPAFSFRGPLYLFLKYLWKCLSVLGMTVR